MSSKARGNVFTDIFLPTLIFPALSFLAFKTIFGYLFASGLGETLAAQCPALPASAVFSPEANPHLPYLLSYTGVRSIDQGLCWLVAFFHVAMGSTTAMSFLTYFIGVGAPFILLSSTEADREGASVWVKYPFVWGLLTQVLTIGAITPLYWLTFILTGSFEQRKSYITQAHSQATAFGVFVGAIIPSVSMLILDDPHVTAIWQLYPAFVALARAAHLTWRPANKYPQSGYFTMQMLYLGAFMISSSVHISTIFPLLDITNLQPLKTFLVPWDALPAEVALDAGMQAMVFLKWDYFFGFLSTAIATLWFADDMNQVLAMIGWYIVAFPVAGPGAAVMAVALWRESRLEAENVRARVNTKVD